MIKKERVFNDIRNGEISGLHHRLWKKTGTVNYKQAAT